MLQMRMELAWIVIASLCMVGTANAKICKTVGADGSVTYTDRPAAADCDGDMNAASPPAPSAPATSSQQSRAHAQPAAAKQSQVATAASSTPEAAPAETNAAIEQSIVGIMGLDDLVQRSYDLCIGVLPTSMVRYGDAADGWRDRNNRSTLKARRALAQVFDSTQQRSIMDAVRLRNQKSLAAVSAAPKASQIKWCDETAAQIEGRALDAKESLTQPLAIY